MQNIKWHEKLNPSIGVMWHGVCAKDLIEPNRYLYDHELVFFNAGSSRVVTPKRTFHCVKGDLIIIPPGMMHLSQCLTDNVERYCVHFDFESGHPKQNPPYVFVGKRKFISDNAKPAPKWLPMEFPFFRRFGDSRKPLELLKEMFHIHPPEDAAGALKRKALLINLLALSLEEDEQPLHLSPSGKSMRTVLKVKGHIDQHYAEDIVVDELARLFKTTTSHLCRIFRENLGVTPARYLRRVRLEEARRQITETSLSIAEISYAVGFNDPNYFARAFRAEYGIQPSKYTD